MLAANSDVLPAASVSEGPDRRESREDLMTTARKYTDERVEALDTVLLVRGRPQAIVCDKGPEFVSLAPDQ